MFDNRKLLSAVLAASMSTMLIPAAAFADVAQDAEGVTGDATIEQPAQPAAAATAAEVAGGSSNLTVTSVDKDIVKTDTNSRNEISFQLLGGDDLDNEAEVSEATATVDDKTVGTIQVKTEAELLAALQLAKSENDSCDSHIIELQDDISVSQTITLGDNVTINGNSHNINVATWEYDNWNYILSIEGSFVSVQDLTIDGSTGDGTAVDYTMGICFENASATLSNVTIKNVDDAAFDIYKSSVVVKDNFKIENDGWSGLVYLSLAGNDEATVSLDVSAATVAGVNMAFVRTTDASKSDKVSITTPATGWTKVNDTACAYSPESAVQTKIGEAKYCLIGDAIAVANDDDVISLQKDLALSSNLCIYKPLKLDLCGKTLNTSTNVYTIYVYNVSGEVDIFNGTVDSSCGAAIYNENTTNLNLGSDVDAEKLIVNGWVWSEDVVTYNQASTVTIKKNCAIDGLLEIKGKGEYDSTSSNSDVRTPTLNIYGTVSNSSTFAVATNGADRSQPIINIYEDASITCTCEDAAAIYIPNCGSANIYGGTITGIASAIGFKNGTLNISGGTLTATGEDSTPTKGYSNGIYASGAAIQLEDNDGYYYYTKNNNNESVKTNEIFVNITGGTVKSNNGYAIYEYLAVENGTNKSTDSHVKSIVISGNNTSVTGAKGSFLISEELANAENPILITGGVFSSDPSAYVTDIAATDTSEAVTNQATYVTCSPSSATVTVGDTVVKNGQYVVSAAGAAYTATASGYYPANGKVPAVLTNSEESSGDGFATLDITLSARPATSTSSTNNSDGSTTTTVTDNTTGTKTETTTSSDGNKVNTTVTDAAGKVVSTTETVTETFDNSTVVTETTTDADGNKTITETAKDDSKTVVSVTKPDGSQTMDVAATNGVTVAIEANAQSEITKFDVTIPENTGEGDAVTLPVTVNNFDAAGEVAINMTVQGSGAKVEVPVDVESADADASLDGLVAILVDDDGNEQIIKLSGVTDSGLLLNLEGGSNQIKLVDNSKTFADVEADAGSDWYEDAVSFVSAREIMNGDGGLGATNFAPSTELNRGMMVQILFNLDNADADDIAGTDTFGDIGSAWYAQAANWALEQGITNGYGNGNFGGDDLITREQAVTMLYRYAGEPDADASTLNSFVDAAGVSSYAQAAMAWATQAGIITGKNNVNLAATDTATRAEVAVMAKRFCNYMARQ